jgi:hypothetical protein
LHLIIQIPYLETTITHHKKEYIVMKTVAGTRQMVLILITFCSLPFCSILDASTKVRPKPARTNDTKADAADKAATEKAGLTTKIAGLRTKLEAFEKKLKSPDGAIEEQKSSQQTKFEGLLKQLTQAATKSGVASGYSTTWASLASSVTWVSQASIDKKKADAKIAKLNKSLETIKNKLVGKALTNEDKAKAEKRVESLAAQVTAAGGKPSVTWAMIAPLLKERADDEGSAQRYLAKALKIKIALSTKTVTQEQADALKMSYTKNRTKALAGNPSLASQLPDAALLSTKISDKKSVFGFQPKSGDAAKLDALIKELNGINSVLKAGVTSSEEISQVAKFKKKAEAAQKLKASLKSSKTIPEQATPKYVSENQAADKYLEGIKKIDAQLTAPPSKLRPMTEARRLKLITQRDSLEKKVAALGMTSKIPEKPKQATVSGSKVGDSDDDKPGAAEGSSTGPSQKKKGGDDDDNDAKPLANGAQQSSSQSSSDAINQGIDKSGRKVVIGEDGKEYFVEKRTFGKDKYYDKNGNEIVKGNVPLPGATPAAHGTGGSMMGAMLGSPAPMGGGMMGPSPMMMGGMGIAGAGVGMAGMGMAAGSGMAYAAAAPVTPVADAGPAPTKKDFIDIEKADPALTALDVPTITSNPLTHILLQANLTVPAEDLVLRKAVIAQWNTAWHAVAAAG